MRSNTPKNSVKAETNPYSAVVISRGLKSEHKQTRVIGVDKHVYTNEKRDNIRKYYHVIILLIVQELIPQKITFQRSIN